LLPIQKIHFTHLQRYDENHRVYLQQEDVTAKKAGGNVTMQCMHIKELFVFA